ncbi:MAG TPA: hypothetical protein VGR28_09750 [Candidatus Thermoplasmatota archaeon]|nr:hypothetical protein [Candidatus Thermoplasmatota archaeon]
MQTKFDRNYVEVVLKCPVKMEEKLIEQILQYNEWVELQEKMQGTMVLKPEWLT